MKIGQKIHLTLESATANNSVMSKEVINAEIKKPVTKEQIEIVTEDIQVNGPITHLVVKGDTVYSICKRYEISPDQLKEWNNLEGNNIGLGQKLKVSQ
jgi:LysM repeat protein